MTMTTVDQQDVQARAAEVRDWVLTERDTYGRMTLFIDGFARTLISVGVPLDRLTFHVRQIHPNLRARTYEWDREAGGTVDIGRQYGIETTDIYLRSPVREIFEGARAVEQRFDDPSARLDYPIYEELRNKGITHYLMLALEQWVLGPAAVSFATRAKAGFSKADRSVIERSLAAFSLAVELQETRQLSRRLLDLYVGRDAGAKVLDGTIRRGDTQRLFAVVFYCDMRDSTALSEALDPADAVAVLNDYFDAVAGPVSRNGGEILKFIGDGVLAIFPCPDEEPEHGCAIAQAALKAAAEVKENVRALSWHCPETGERAMDCGIALHVGALKYGNVGAADRLDFTVIGPAVNLVFRMEPLCKEGGAGIVVSKAFANRSGLSYCSLGERRFKGIAEPQEVFMPEA